MSAGFSIEDELSPTLSAGFPPEDRGLILGYILSLRTLFFLCVPASLPFSGWGWSRPWLLPSRWRDSAEVASARLMVNVCPGNSSAFSSPSLPQTFLYSTCKMTVRRHQAGGAHVSLPQRHHCVSDSLLWGSGLPTWAQFQLTCDIIRLCLQRK